MRTTEGPGCNQTLMGWQKSHNRMNFGCLQGFVKRHIRQDRWKALSQHAFAASRGTDHQDIMDAIQPLSMN